MNEIVKSKFSDKRIRYIEFKENQGSYWSVEHGIKKARGKYIAFIGSDDYWEKDKLDSQISALKNKRNIGAVFYEPTLVDKNGNNFFQDGLFSNAPDFNGTRFSELHHFFYNMNGLCWSSALIERKLLEKASWKMGRYKQLCDKKHWINCLKKKNIYVLPDKNKVFYRIHTNNECLSDLDKVHNRVILENAFLLMDYLKFSAEELNNIFKTELSDENLKFTEKNKVFVFTKMCNRKTKNPIVNRALNLAGAFVWFENFGNKEVSSFQYQNKISNNEMLEISVPTSFDVRLN